MDILQALKNRKQNETVAISKNGPVDLETFLSKIVQWKEFFNKSQINSVVLFCSDRIVFTTALLGAWCSHVRTILPTDMTAYTKSELQKEGAYFISDETPIPVLNVAQKNYQELELPLSEELVELFTSGSTGKPTRVKKTLKQVLADIDTLDSLFPVQANSNSVVFSTVSHQHIYGFLWTVLWPLASGKVLTETRLLFPENVLQALLSVPHATLVMSPAHLKRLPLDLSWEIAQKHLDLLLSSGGPLPETALFLCQKTFKQTPIEILGSTELDGIAWRQRRITLDGKIDNESCSWKAMPGTTVSSTEQGILQVKSERLNPHSWTVGNDKISLNADGSFSLLGRTDRIVKIEEKRLSLTAMEKSLVDSGLFMEAKTLLLPNDSQLAVVAVPSAKGREILKEGKLELIKVAQRHLRIQFEAVLLPHRWRFEPLMPTNSQGKCTIDSLVGLFDKRHVEPSNWQIGHNKFRITFKANKHLPFFEGHFPQWPILPGVAQLNLAIIEANRYLKTSVDVIGVSNLKFMSIIRPETTLVMACVFDPEKFNLKFVISSEDETRRYSSGTIHYANSMTHNV